MSKINPNLLTANSTSFLITVLNREQGQPDKLTFVTLSPAAKGTTSLSVVISVPDGYTAADIPIVNGTFFIAENQIITLDGTVQATATTINIDPLNADLPMSSIFTTYINSVPLIGLEAANLQLNREANQTVLLLSNGWINKDYSTGSWQFSGNMLIPVSTVLAAYGQRIKDALLTEKSIWCERILSNGKYFAGRAIATDASDSVTGNAYVTIALTLQGSGKILSEIYETPNDIPIDSDLSPVGYDIVLAIGQSNMIGWNTGEYNSTLDTTNPKAEQRPKFGASANTNILLQNPVDFPQKQSNTSVSLVTSFAREYINDNKLYAQRKILILPLAFGATGFIDNKWGVGNDHYVGAIEFTNLMLAMSLNNRLVAIIWHQGELDCGNLTKAQYIPELDAMIGGMRNSIMNAVEVPFILGELSRDWVGSDPGRLAIQEAIQGTAARVGRTAVTSSLGLTGVAGDEVHFTGSSCRELGQRYYDNLMIAVSNIPVPPPPITDYNTALQWNYKFENGFVDSSPNNVTATPSNGVSIESDTTRGMVAVFSGGQNNILVNSGIGPSYTKVAWIYSNSVPNNHAIMACDADPTHLLWTSNITFGQSGDYFALSAPNPLVADTWTHIAVTFTGTTAKIYVDGAKVAERINNSTFAGMSSFTKIGNFDGGQGWQGKMDDVRLYEAALTDAQVLQIYNATLL